MNIQLSEDVRGYYTRCEDIQGYCERLIVTCLIK